MTNPQDIIGSRKIKVRCWDNKKKEWYLLPNWSDCNANGESFEGGIVELHNDEFFTWTEFTGLLDKNGREIYEGDVLVDAKDKNNGGTHVFYDHGVWQPFSYLSNYNGEDYEIIGNIFENPELISSS